MNLYCGMLILVLWYEFTCTAPQNRVLFSALFSVVQTTFVSGKMRIFAQNETWGNRKNSDEGFSKFAYARIYRCMVHSEQARQMFEQHYREMYRLAVTMLHDEDESRDVVGDVFVRVLERTSLLDTATARAFLLQSVRRRCVSELRRRSVRERVQRLLPLETDEDTPVPSAEDRAMLRRGVQALQPPVCRDIVLWHFRDGMKFREIAERLQVSETTVYKHLRRALDQLRVHFKKEKP